MHMADALLSPAVGLTMCVASAAALGVSVKKVQKDELCTKKIPIMGVMGAFVFAAQMVNIAIPATGSSGHIGGGILLAAMVGGYPALLALSAVLVIQCLFFADGGLLALGCNIWNLGVIPCLLTYPLIFRPLLARRQTKARITAASFLAALVALQLGAFAVVLETTLSGVAALPFAAFALLMQPIHLAIGLLEGAVTAAVLCFIHQMRPELLESAGQRSSLRPKTRLRPVVVVLVCLALLTGGLLSLLASEQPDGLEWSVEKAAGQPLDEAETNLATSLMPGYALPGNEEAPLGTSLAGLLGTALTFLLAGGTALGISLYKRRRRTCECEVISP